MAAPHHNWAGLTLLIWGHNMTLYDKIIAAYPELAENTKAFIDGTISLRNDADDFGDYIETWNYTTPLTKELQQYLRK